MITTFKAGLNDPGRPVGVMLFIGPTGVGKTELARAMSRFLFGHGEPADRLLDDAELRILCREVDEHALVEDEGIRLAGVDRQRGVRGRRQFDELRVGKLPARREISRRAGQYGDPLALEVLQLRWRRLRRAAARDEQHAGGKQLEESVHWRTIRGVLPLPVQQSRPGSRTRRRAPSARAPA